jgi:hypothetical protein
MQKILGAIMNILGVMATWGPGFVQAWLMVSFMLGSYWFLISFNRNSVADYKELMRAGYDQ